MQCDVTRCIICISNKVEFLDKEQSYKNSTKEVIVILSELCGGVARGECLGPTLSDEATNHVRRSRHALPGRFWISKSRKRDFSPSDTPAEI